MKIVFPYLRSPKTCRGWFLILEYKKTYYIINQKLLSISECLLKTFEFKQVSKWSASNNEWLLTTCSLSRRLQHILTKIYWRNQENLQFNTTYLKDGAVSLNVKKVDDLDGIQYNYYYTILINTPNRSEQVFAASQKTFHCVKKKPSSDAYYPYKQTPEFANRY